MNKNTLKSIIELQADRISQLEAVVKVRRKEMGVLENRLKAYQAESKSHKENAEKWNREANRVNEILDKKDQEYQHLKRNYNAFKEKNDNLLIANGKLIKENKELKLIIKAKSDSATISSDTFTKELKEVETRYEKKIDGMSKSYGEEIKRRTDEAINRMYVMSLEETLRLFKQIENAIEPNPFEPPYLGMEHYMEKLYMGQHQRESIQIVLSDMDTKGMEDEEIVQEAEKCIRKRIKDFKDNACSPRGEWLKLFNFKVGGE